MIKLEVDDAMTRAYPALQGGEVEVTEVGGATHHMRLDNVVYATAQEVRDRFRSAAAGVVGGERAGEIEQFIDRLERSEDVGALGALLQAVQN